MGEPLLIKIPASMVIGSNESNICIRFPVWCTYGGYIAWIKQSSCRRTLDGGIEWRAFSDWTVDLILNERNRHGRWNTRCVRTVSIRTFVKQIEIARNENNEFYEIFRKEIEE